MTSTIKTRILAAPFFPKNFIRRCSLSARTFGKGAVSFCELTFLWKHTEINTTWIRRVKFWSLLLQDFFASTRAIGDVSISLLQAYILLTFFINRSLKWFMEAFFVYGHFFRTGHTAWSFHSFTKMFTLSRNQGLLLQQ